VQPEDIPPCSAAEKEGDVKILDTLRKLGILRYGATAATYTSAKDRPDELFMDGVYNAEKELVAKEDFEKVKDALPGKK
jgi:hypothetical protein